LQKSWQYVGSPWLSTPHFLYMHVIHKLCVVFVRAFEKHKSITAVATSCLIDVRQSTTNICT